MNVRGSVLEARVRYMKERGMEAFARFLTALSPEVRALADGELRPEAFYPVAHFLEMLDVIDEQLAGGDETFCFELGKACCDLNLGTFHRFFLRIGSIQKAIDRAKAAWRIHYDAGDLDVVERGPASVKLRLRGLPFDHVGFGRSVQGWIVRLGEHTGAAMRPTRLDWTAAGDGTHEVHMEFVW